MGRCHCIFCNREFDYGDEWSPMLKNELWNRIIDYYDLHDKEIANSVLFNYYYDLWIKNRGTELGDEYNQKCTDHETLICYPCMERALGRELTFDDLINKDVPLNQEFEDNVLKVRIKNNPPEN